MRTSWTAIGLAAAALFALSAQQSAKADTTSGLLDALLANHTITQAQYDQMKSQQATDQAAVPTTAVPASAYPNVRINGKVQFDVPLYAQSNDKLANIGSSALFRRLFINANGFLTPDWAFRAEMGVQSGAFAVSNAWVSYRGFNPTALTFGYQNAQFGLDNLTADENRIFTEQDLTSTTFAPGKQIGLVANSHGGFWEGSIEASTGAAAIAAPAVNSATNWAGFARGTLFPLNQNGMVGMVGVDVGTISASSTAAANGTAHTLTLSAAPEQTVTATKYITTGAMANVGGEQVGGLEAAFAAGPLLISGEWMGAQLSHNNLPAVGALHKPWFSGYYAQASYVLTGESRAFDTSGATFGGVTPAHPLGQGGFGALELALRYSSVDLVDQGGIGAAVAPTQAAPGTQGVENDWTLGANWYPVKGLREELNWTHVDNIKSPSPLLSGVHADLVVLRTQLVF